MIRRTLELLCADREAIGDNLEARISSLREELVIPKALLNGMDKLRRLGNDAAHVKSRVFDEIGQTEVDIAFEVTLEILKATYQYSALVEKLAKLERPKTAPDAGAT